MSTEAGGILMKMKKVLVLLTVAFVAMSLFACGGDPIQDDLMNYVNEGLPQIAELENTVTEAYQSVTGDNYSDDETMYNVIQNEVIPASLLLIDAIESISPETVEVRNLNETYISAVNIQNQAFTTILAGLENEDYDKITEANDKLDTSRKLMRDFSTDLEALAAEHNVTFGEE
jgi:hypothetical protein